MVAIGDYYFNVVELRFLASLTIFSVTVFWEINEYLGDPRSRSEKFNMILMCVVYGSDLTLTVNTRPLILFSDASFSNEINKSRTDPRSP